MRQRTETWRSQSSPVVKSLALNSDLSVSSVNDIKFTESLPLVVVGCFFMFVCLFVFFPWGKSCSAGT